MALAKNCVELRNGISVIFVSYRNYINEITAPQSAFVVIVVITAVIHFGQSQLAGKQQAMAMACLWGSGGPSATFKLKT